MRLGLGDGGEAANGGGARWRRRVESDGGEGDGEEPARSGALQAGDGVVGDDGEGSVMLLGVGFRFGSVT